jgi:glutamate dehydrogenase
LKYEKHLAGKNGGIFMVALSHKNTDSYGNVVAEKIAAIVAAATQPLSAHQRLFIEQFYQKLPVMDLERLVPARAAAIALSAFTFAQTRKPNEIKIRIYSPRQAVHGWESDHTTIVEILNDDMPFLVDSISAELQRLHLTPLQTIHPIISLKRDAAGALNEVVAASDAGKRSESFIHFRLPLLPADITPESLDADIREVLAAVRSAVQDWGKMSAKCAEVEASLATLISPVKADEVEEVRDFFRWLQNKNFVFLGAISYDFYDAAGNEAFRAVEGSELGLFTLDNLELKPQGLTGLPPEVQHFALVPHLLEITKATRKSVVHRPVHMDYIGLKRFDSNGRVIGETRFLGLFTSTVYYQSAIDIPIIRRKINRVLARANFDPNSYDGKALKAILEFSPRDELFQMTEEDLFHYAMGVLSLEAHPDVHLFIRRDAFERFISCMVFIPRDRFNTSLREQIQAILEASLKGSVTAFYTQMTDAPLARAHIIVRTTPGKIPEFNQDEIQRRIATLTYRWADMLRDGLHTKFGEAEGEQLFLRYQNAFSQAYINNHDIKNAVYDITRVREVIRTDRLGLELYRDEKYGQNEIHLKFYSPEGQAALSDILPMLENLGFRVQDENPFRVTPQGEKRAEIWIRDFHLSVPAQQDIDIKPLKARLEEVLTKVWEGAVENDGFNALALQAGLDWRQITLLRAYSRYARQAALPYSDQAITTALRNNAAIAQKLVALFEARFDPAAFTDADARNVAAGEILSEANTLLATVSSLEEDRILRRLRDLILATWRTNYYQRDAEGKVKEYLSFKLNSKAIPELPLPRPHAEIFVYSLRMEGIHLRGGKVARGGLRWSDRREDYRTEVLGLMKAQMVKNAVIVPVGSKGGFVLKRPPQLGGREALMAEGIACYQNYLRGLLDITDNIVDGAIVPPVLVVRHDGDDPYLVVAADKGTATFSDYANAVSAEYNFWLGDAFASGGSVGYDHKVMGITAKGAWISVRRHFREMGKDTQKEDFTVMGIGDMAGDVFGNGMLLSPHIRLLGAFNHIHIFLDPNPDAAKSFVERQRLFNTPRTTWLDYDRSLISQGGGIFNRSDKEIPLSPEIRAMLQVTEKSLTPDALMQAMLKAPVDLLWNGGIGTYVKAESESHESVGDRANNALRINGNELRAKVVGEGGNLGFTQLGRIEYALSGGRLNTDAIDNSAGVDCSDHEVNIKIAFRQALEEKTLTVEQRNIVLSEMTEDVSELVLRDNQLQTQAISTAQSLGFAQLESQARMMQGLERMGLLDRKVEYLPSDKILVERRQAQQGLTRPELAVLLSYAKMAIYNELLDSDFPDESYLQRDLLRYFPQAMRERFVPLISAHRLRREIIATAVTNSIVNRAGITFFFQMQEDTGLPACDIARAFIVARDIFRVRDLWLDIESASSEISAQSQAALYAQTSLFLERVMNWLLRHLPQPLKIEDTMARYADAVDEYLKDCDNHVSGALKKAYTAKRDRFVEMGTTEELAHRVARLEIASSALDVARAAHEANLPIVLTSRVYFEIGAKLKLGWLRREASRMPSSGYWERAATKSVINEFYGQQRRLAASVLATMKGQEDAEKAVAEWLKTHHAAAARFTGFIEDIRANEKITFPMLVIALRNADAMGG